MKYETPELTVLIPAINAIQSTGGTKGNQQNADSPFLPDSGMGAYEDWE